MYEHMLVPYDESEEATKGAEHAIELAAELDSTIHGLYVIDLPGAPRAVSIRDDEESLRKQYRNYGENILAELGETAAEHGVEYEPMLRTGNPSEEIVEAAAEEDMDVVVIGSAYRGKLGDLLGGTATRVVQNAEVPVITLRMRMDEV
jgi:nucleotide-binding universal stress UspA family protein